MLVRGLPIFGFLRFITIIFTEYTDNLYQYTQNRTKTTTSKVKKKTKAFARAGAYKYTNQQRHRHIARACVGVCCEVCMWSVFAAGCISLCSIGNSRRVYSYGGVINWVVGACISRWVPLVTCIVRTPHTNYTTIICVVCERIKMCLINKIY